jgi:NTP pyrophosphatase (non-canonical NTP hydrolase)
MDNIQAIIDAIIRERMYQDRKWGTIEQHPHTVGEWLLIMKGELDEAILAWQKGKGDAGALKELLQVVAVGFAAMEQHGAIERVENITLASYDPRNG